MTDFEIIEILKVSGHLDSPFGEHRKPIQDISDLSLTDRVVMDAVESYQSFFAMSLEPYIAEEHPSRTSAAVRVDGIVGSAFRRFAAAPRCWCPDYSQEPAPVVGSGNWARCHGAGEFHKAFVYIKNQPPSFVAPMFQDIWEDVVDCYAEMGLLLEITEDASKANFTLDFVNPRTVSPANLRGGWIGLAIVGHGLRCSDTVWGLFDKDYQPSNIYNEWRTLIIHEIGHICGLNHTSGGFMNPSIVRGLGKSFINDPSHRIMKNRYGGVPFPRTPKKRNLVLAWQTGNQFEVIQEIPVPSSDVRIW